MHQEGHACRRSPLRQGVYPALVHIPVAFFAAAAAGRSGADRFRRAAMGLLLFSSTGLPLPSRGRGFAAASTAEGAGLPSSACSPRPQPTATLASGWEAWSQLRALIG
jgi:hypothetical protein